MDCSSTPVKNPEAVNINFIENDFPKVSVVVPVYNNAEGLKYTITALQQQTYPKEKLEIIVVDNNSTDGSDRVAMQSSETNLVYERDIQNAGAARNKGLFSATGSIIAFTDADCIPSPDWLMRGVITIQKRMADRVAGQITIDPITPESAAASLMDAVYNFHQELLIQTYNASVTANLFVKRSVFDSIGGFHPEFFELEDMEFGRRASAAGFSLAYASDCIVFHPPRLTFAALWKKGKRSGGGVFLICKKEKLGGWMGWKHPLRVLKMLLWPRRLHWERLPFPRDRIPFSKQLEIYTLLWITVNLAEAIGYTQWGLRYLKQKSIELIKN